MPSAEALERQGRTQPPSIVVFVHGGAWAFGSKFQYGGLGRFVADALGVVVAVINYSTYPRGNMAEMVNDVERAVAFLRARASDFGARASGLVVFGQSAGAHLAVSAALHEAVRRAKLAPPPFSIPTISSTALASSLSSSLSSSPSASSTSSTTTTALVLPPPSIGAVFALSGPYCIARHYRFEAARNPSPDSLRWLVPPGVEWLSPMLPAAEGWENFDAHSPAREADDLSPAARSLLPPIALAHGTQDKTVPVGSTFDLAQGILGDRVVVDRPVTTPSSSTSAPGAASDAGAAALPAGATTPAAEKRAGHVARRLGSSRDGRPWWSPGSSSSVVAPARLTPGCPPHEESSLRVDVWEDADHFTPIFSLLDPEKEPGHAARVLDALRWTVDAAQRWSPEGPDDGPRAKL